MLNSYMPNWGVRTPYYLPDPVEIPDGAELKLTAFDFPNIAGLAMGKQSIGFSVDTLLWGMTRWTSSVLNPASLVQFYHNHRNGRRQWFPTHLASSNVIGSAQKPFLFNSLYLVEAGDDLTIELKSLDKAQQSFQIVLWGAEVL